MKKRTTDRFLEFFRSNPNKFFTCVQLREAFPDVKETSIWGTAANLHRKGAINKHGKAYGIGDATKDTGPVLASVKYCPHCHATKNRKAFNLIKHSSDGLSEFCTLCTTKRLEKGADDLLKDLLKSLPATTPPHLF